MKITFNRESMLSACQNVSGACSTKDVKPSLKSILCVVDKDCTLMATDMEIGMRLDLLGVGVHQPGEVLFPPKFINILRESTSEEMTAFFDKDKLLVRGTQGKFEMPTVDAKEFPPIPDFDADAYCEIDGKALGEMIDKTTFASGVIGGDQGRKFGATTGILIEPASSLIMVSTNGRGMAKMESAATMNGAIKNTVMPVKTLRLLSNSLRDGVPVLVCLREADALFKTGNTVIHSRALEGRFPDWKRHVPTEFKHKMTLTVGPLLSLIRQSMVMTDEMTKKVTFDFSNNKLTMTTVNSVLGEAELSMPIDFDGTLSMMFDPSVIASMLAKLEPDSMISFEANAHNKAAVIKSGEFLYMAMPMWERTEK